MKQEEANSNSNKHNKQVVEDKGAEEDIAAEEDNAKDGRASRQKQVTEEIHGTTFIVMKKKGVEATLDLECPACHSHRRCTFDTSIDKDK